MVDRALGSQYTWLHYNPVIPSRSSYNFKGVVSYKDNCGEWEVFGAILTLDQTCQLS